MHTDDLLHIHLPRPPTYPLCKGTRSSTQNVHGARTERPGGRGTARQCTARRDTSTARIRERTTPSPHATSLTISDRQHARAGFDRARAGAADAGDAGDAAAAAAAATPPHRPPPPPPPAAAPAPAAAAAAAAAALLRRVHSAAGRRASSRRRAAVDRRGP